MIPFSVGSSKSCYMTQVDVNYMHTRLSQISGECSERYILVIGQIHKYDGHLLQRCETNGSPISGSQQLTVTNQHRFGCH